MQLRIKNLRFACQSDNNNDMMKHKFFISLITLFWVINASAVIPGKTAVQHTDYISLFNGNDLTGWGYRVKTQEGVIFKSFDGKTESKDKRFIAKGGSLTAFAYKTGDEERYANLWTAKEFPADFVLILEFRASRNADSGIFLRGIQLQCRDYPRVGPYKNLKNYNDLDWNKIEVVVKNNIAHCTCNGELLEEALKIPATGPIGLESDQGQMEYRNIRLTELK